MIVHGHHCWSNTGSTKCSSDILDASVKVQEDLMLPELGNVQMDSKMEKGREISKIKIEREK